MIVALLYDLTTGEITVPEIAVRSSSALTLNTGSNEAPLIGETGDKEGEYVTGIGAGPTVTPRPALTLSATEATADGTENITVTVPADAAPVALYADGEPVLDEQGNPVTWTTAGDRGLGADAPATVDLRPAFPYLTATVVFS